MPTIEIEIKNKIAVSPNAEIVCGNGTYEVAFSFDSEWKGVVQKTARFVYNGTYEDVLFEGDKCPVPVIANATVCAVGVFAGDLHTTTPALVTCQKSIRCGEAVPATHSPDAYTQVLQMYDRLSKDVEELRESVENGGGEVDTEAIETAVEKYLQENPPAGGEKKWELISETEINTEDEVALIEFDGLENYNEAMLSVICPWSGGHNTTAVVKINGNQVEKDWYYFQSGNLSKYNVLSIKKIQDGYYEVLGYAGGVVDTTDNRFGSSVKFMATYTLPISKMGFTLSTTLATSDYGKACVVRCFAR